MEIDVGGGGDGVASLVGVRVSGGGGCSKEEEKKLFQEGEQKVKRKMKTDAQLQVLERTYAVEPNPAEALRGELSIKLGLSDRQLQMWFCHRRLKDRKAKSMNMSSPPALAGVGNNLMIGSGSTGELGNEINLGKSSSSHVDMLQPQIYKHQPGSAVARIGVGGERPPVKRQYEFPQAISKVRAIALVEAQLGEPVKTDGPILGMEFDPLPPGAFGQPKPIGRPCELYGILEASPYKAVERAMREYQFLPEHPSVRSDAYKKAQPSRYNGSSLDVQDVSTGCTPSILMPSPSLFPQPGKPGDYLSLVDINIAPRITSAIEVAGNASHGSHLNSALEIPFMAIEKKILYNDERLDRKRKGEEARIAREVEAHEKRIRKELEKQDMLQRKREEQIRKELERQERERRKEEERLLREKLREEERLQRELRREMERKERFLQKEYLRVEKMRVREELRKEREAAKLKAANNRATARRMAKESVELIEDERLELMELAVSKKGLQSISELDSDTLGILESFEDMLPDFPFKSVELKTPFNIQPWVDSEENVGNLLMVWRFLINFSDVLGLWPFTLDEFLQAFHDHDTRLMGEVHMALIRIIVKDIEDAARTPVSAVGANQSSVVNPAGGHPYIVEGAYGWGFDIKSWQRHINALTWPEILRQLALSAGFGPKLKKNSVGRVYLPDEIEGNDGADVISNLRNGIAAENALAKMQERGLSNPRRSRHRLTPGTVKYAAYHVLSLEGSKGLTIQDVADKIQKSGLRDLGTSKTPEASISTALSRDTKLFQRTAPSTYCVRTPFRKDATDAETILAAAREKIELYTGNLEGDEADDVEKENTERDEDSESEGAEDHEVVNLHSGLNFNEDIVHKTTGISSTSGHYTDIEATNEENSVVDENYKCEPWVEGLTEGEYYDLSVEERLDALVALVGVANEGNSIRSTLEERLEAAYALKKRMWAEAKVDKRRLKEGRQSPFVDDVKIGFASDNQGIDTNVCFAEKTLQELAAGAETSAYAFEKSKSQLKSYISHKVEETYVYRSLPLGQDRRRNRYWQFITSQSEDDPGSCRIFVELHDGRWRVIDSIISFDSLLASLDVRGIRESHLHLMLQNIEASFKKAVRRHYQKKPVDEIGDDNVELKSEDSIPDPAVSTSFTIELGRNSREELEVVKRYLEFEKWMWKECYVSGMLCAMKYGKRRCEPFPCICEYCHNSYYFEDNLCPPSLGNQNLVVSNLKFLEHVTECKNKREKEPEWMLHILESSPPIRVRLLKGLLASLEALVPPEAFDIIWSKDYRDLWITKLKDASSAADIFQSLTLLEGAITRSFLSSEYETTVELLQTVTTGSPFDYSSLRVVPVLPWIPQTTSAVALRLMEFDKSICYTLQQKDEMQKNSVLDNFMAMPSKYTQAHNVTEDMLIEPPGQGPTAEGTPYRNAGKYLNQGGRRPHNREGKSQGITLDANGESRQRRPSIKGEDPRHLPVWKGKSRGQGGKGRRKSAKKRRKKAKQVAKNTISKAGSRKIVIKTTLSSKQLDDYEPASALNDNEISCPEQSPSNYYIAPPEGSGCLNGSHAISVKHIYDAVDEQDSEQDDVDQHPDEDVGECYQPEPDEEGDVSSDKDEVKNSDGESIYSYSDYSE